MARTNRERVVRGERLHGAGRNRLLADPAVNALLAERFEELWHEGYDVGFVLAERDLQQRGPGDFLGTRQSGFAELQMASLTDIKLIEKALSFYQEAGYPKETTNALIELANAHSDKGEDEVATQILEKVLASDLVDPEQLAIVHSNMGTLLGVELEKYPQALEHVDESYKINTLRGSKARAASAAYGRRKEASAECDPRGHEEPAETGEGVAPDST